MQHTEKFKESLFLELISYNWTKEHSYPDIYEKITLLWAEWHGRKYFINKIRQITNEYDTDPSHVNRQCYFSIDTAENIHKKIK